MAKPKFTPDPPPVTDDPALLREWMVRQFERIEDWWPKSLEQRVDALEDIAPGLVGTIPIVEGFYMSVEGWSQQTVFDLPNECLSGTSEFFGSGVDYTDNYEYLYVGCYGYNSSTGRVRIYQWDGSSFTELTSLTSPSPGSNLQFGYSVAVSGDGTVLAVGEPGTVFGSHKIHIFSGSGASWSHQATITSPYGEDGTGSEATWFGRSVELNESGTKLLAGGTGFGISGITDPPNLDEGRAWYYESSTPSGYTSTPVSTYPAESNVDNGYYGSGVAMSATGSVIGIGAPGERKVYIYRGGSTYTVTPNTGTSTDDFGESIALSSDGSVLAIGAPRYVFDSAAKGRVEIFTWSGSGYTYSQGFNNPVASIGKWGHNVSLNGAGTLVAIGAYIQNQVCLYPL